ncbi:MAG: glycoside hydrolase family 13 protein [Gaiellaceae bacterium]
MALRGQVSCALAVCALALSAAPAKGALLHDTFNPAYRSPTGAVPTGTNVRLRLRVTGERVKAVALRIEVGDPATDTATLRTIPMRRARTFWSTTYRTPAKPSIVNYTFRVTTKRGVRWYGDDDSATDSRKGGTGRTTRSRGDAFQLTVYASGFTTPAWLQGAFVYEIFVDRFRNGDPSNDPCRPECPIFYGSIPATLHAKWNEPPEDARATGTFNRDFFGGDLQGITEKLDYLQALGVDAIWLTPIFKARSNHRYDTDDYNAVDPILGGDAAYAALKAAANAKGIRVILDGVFNHTSSDSLYFDKYHRYPSAGACESPSSPYRDWYSITGDCTDYAKFAGLDTLPQLNQSNPAVRDFEYSVTRHWSPDGWRLDAAQEIAHRWWAEFRKNVSAPLIGEVTAGPVDASPYLAGNELDGVMNYRFRQAVLGFVRTTPFSDSSGSIRPLTGTQLDHALKAMLEDYPRAASAVSFNLVDSHDTNRVRFVLNEDPDFEISRARQQLAALLQFTSFGAPMVYYGDETGFYVPGKNGFADPYNRATFPWPDTTSNPPFEGGVDPRMGDYYARLAAIRHALPALRTGSLTTLFTNATVYGFARVAAPDRPVLVVLNKGAQPASVDVSVRGLYPNGTVLRDQKSSFQATVSRGRVHVELFPHDGVILVGTT